MDSIPGYQSQPDVALFTKTVRGAGCAIIGATPDLAPADKIIYAIRDVTATVESLDLITASILSKKLAAGLQGLVMDVKFGTGAFMRRYEDAKALAESIVKVANGAGLPTVGLLTDMNQVLGRSAGNALEVAEAIEYLKGKDIDPRLHEVNVSLTSELLVLGKLAKNVKEAREKIEGVIKNGKAAEHFAKMVAELGGPADLLEQPDKYLKKAPLIKDVMPEKRALVAAFDARAVGIGIVELGGGRSKPTDSIDATVGLTNMAQIGEEVGPGARPLATIHARDEASWKKMATILLRTTTFAEKISVKEELIKMRIAA
jgi:thymidine phosphorylase